MSTEQKGEMGSEVESERGPPGIRVQLPMPLASIVHGERHLHVEASSILDLIESLAKQFPRLRERFLDDQGALRPLVNMFVNGEEVRHLQGLSTELVDGDEAIVIASIAGG